MKSPGVFFDGLKFVAYVEDDACGAPINRIWSEYFDGFEEACRAAKDQARTLNEPVIPSLWDLFERCEPEQAIFRTGNGVACAFLFLCRKNDENDVPAVNCQVSFRYDKALERARTAIGNTIRPKASKA